MVPRVTTTGTATRARALRAGLEQRAQQVSCFQLSYVCNGNQSKSNKKELKMF